VDLDQVGQAEADLDQVGQALVVDRNMSRQPIQTDLLCPICKTMLILEMSGELDLVDHEYGFSQSGMGDGYYCENEHFIIIQTDNEKDDNHYD
jgi:hypothetical protein